MATPKFLRNALLVIGMAAGSIGAVYGQQQQKQTTKPKVEQKSTASRDTIKNVQGVRTILNGKVAQTDSLHIRTTKERSTHIRQPAATTPVVRSTAPAGPSAVQQLKDQAARNRAAATREENEKGWADPKVREAYYKRLRAAREADARAAQDTTPVVTTGYGYLQADSLLKQQSDTLIITHILRDTVQTTKEIVKPIVTFGKNIYFKAGPIQNHTAEAGVTTAEHTQLFDKTNNIDGRKLNGVMAEAGAELYNSNRKRADNPRFVSTMTTLSARLEHYFPSQQTHINGLIPTKDIDDSSMEAGQFGDPTGKNKNAINAFHNNARVQLDQGVKFGNGIVSATARAGLAATYFYTKPKMSLEVDPYWAPGEEPTISEGRMASLNSNRFVAQAFGAAEVAVTLFKKEKDKQKSENEIRRTTDRLQLFGEFRYNHNLTSQPVFQNRHDGTHYGPRNNYTGAVGLRYVFGR